jgi:hypothetical protein
MPSWKRYAGRLGATTLGFAAGDIPGAVAAYKAFDLYEKFFPEESMPASRRRRSRPTRNRRRVKRSKRSTRKSSRPLRLRGGRSGPSEPTQYRAGIKRYKAKSVRIKRKGVKISSAFRKKVKQAVKTTKAHGKLHIQYKNGLVGETSFAENRQYIWQGMADVKDGNYLFTVDQIRNASCVLWNGGLWHEDKFHQPDFAGSWPDWYNMRLHLKNSYAKYNITNVSLRTVHLKVHEVKPKGKQSFNYTTQDNYWAFNESTKAITSLSAGVHRIGNLDTEMDRAIGSAKGVEALAYVDNTSFQTMSKSFIGVHPNMITNFRSRWTTNAINEFVIEPGQEIVVYVQGPKDITIDMEKYVLDGKIYNMDPKFTRGILFTAHLGIVRGATSGSSRMAGGTDANVAILGMEATTTYELTCPDRVDEDATKNIEVWVEQSGTTGRTGGPERPTDEAEMAVD